MGPGEVAGEQQASRVKDNTAHLRTSGQDIFESTFNVLENAACQAVLQTGADKADTTCGSSAEALQRLGYEAG